jgi:Fic family protein
LPPPRHREELEARAAARVLARVEQILHDEPDAPLTEDRIRELHVLTTDGIPYEHNVPGQYRAGPVVAGDYVPPRTAAEVTTLMRGFVDWLNTGDSLYWHPIARAVAAHFYFISIHPFGDGNGRTARAIESYLLFQAHINPVGFYSLANFYYIHRARYIEMLDYTRFESGGDLTPFVRFAAQGLVSELEAVHDEVVGAATQIAFRDYCRSVLRAVRDREVAERLLEFVELLGEDEVAVSEIRDGRHPAASALRGVSSRTVSRDLTLLEERGLIVREAGKVRARLEVMHGFRYGGERAGGSAADGGG